jgi:hypothetical protein
MWFERDRSTVHSMGLDARGRRRLFPAETVAALRVLPPSESIALQDSLAELEADVLVEYDPDDPAIDHDEEDRFRMVAPPAEVAFPTVTSAFAESFSAHVASVPPRWRIDAAALAFELVSTFAYPHRVREWERTADVRRLVARRRRGSRRRRRR